MGAEPRPRNPPFLRLESPGWSNFWVGRQGLSRLLDCCARSACGPVSSFALQQAGRSTFSVPRVAAPATGRPSYPGATLIRIAAASKSTPDWHELFLRMLPAIRQHARIAFRHCNPEAREEAVQAVVCNACVAIARLAELGKLDIAYPGPLARYGVAQVRDGRMTGGSRTATTFVPILPAAEEHHRRAARPL